MRHRINHKMLSVTSSHRSAMLANIACALINHEIITTTLVKAKVVRRYFDKLMTIAKKNNLASIRRLSAEIKSHECVNKLLRDLAIRSSARAGGYTRIVRKGFRRGDATAMAYLELSDRKIVVK